MAGITPSGKIQVAKGSVPVRLHREVRGYNYEVISNFHSLLNELKCCSIRRDLQWGIQIHARAVESGHESNMYIATALIKMYAKCRSMVDAHRVFESIQNPDVVCWTALLLGYTENEDGLSTLELFSKMKACGYVPDCFTYIAALKACTYLAGKQDGECLRWGRQIHAEIGCQMDIFLQNTLIDMYAKSGSVVEARHVFDSIRNPDVVSWTVLLLGYAENGEGLLTLELFWRMKASKCAPNSVTYVAVLKACTSLAEQDDDGLSLKRGKEIHSEIGCHLNIFVQNTLIDMYSKFGSMLEACRVFDEIQKPNVVSWSSLILGYAENGEGLSSLEMFSKMKFCGCAPNSVTYFAALKACGLIGALNIGRKIHSEINEFTAQIVTCLIDLYAKCGSISEARKVFDTHSTARDVSTWTAIVAGYGSLGDSDTVFNLFEEMQEQGIKPNGVTFVCMLSCCGHAGLVGKAKEFFKAMSVQYGITPSVLHYTCMVDVLGRANQLNEAVDLIRKMPCHPNTVTWTTLLAACRKWKNVEIGRFVFQCLVDMDKKNVSGYYVLMADIYGSRSMWEEKKKLLQAREQFFLCSSPSSAPRVTESPTCS